jgi:hypothetical protein
MDDSKCILQLRIDRPFLSDKFDIAKHKNYKYLSDFDDKNIFDIEAYIITRTGFKDTDEYAIFEYAAPDDEIPEEAYADFTSQTADAPEPEVSDDSDEPESMRKITNPCKPQYPRFAQSPPVLLTEDWRLFCFSPLKIEEAFRTELTIIRQNGGAYIDIRKVAEAIGKKSTSTCSAIFAAISTFTRNSESHPKLDITFFSSKAATLTRLIERDSATCSQKLVMKRWRRS